jgi:hypothetical protein
VLREGRKGKKQKTRMKVMKKNDTEKKKRNVEMTVTTNGFPKEL